MQKKLKHIFYKKLITDLSNFNFLLVDSKNINIKKEENFVISKKFYLKQKSFFLIEPEELVKSFKQFFRLLSYIKGRKSYLIHVNFEKEQFVSLFVNWMKKYDKKSQKSNFIIQPHTVLNLKRVNMSNFNIFFSNKVVNYKKMFSNNLLIINEINLNSNFYGTYKIVNDVNNWKKIVFFFFIFKKIFID